MLLVLLIQNTFFKRKSLNQFAAPIGVCAAEELIFSFTTQRGDVARLLSAFIHLETMETAIE